MLVYVDIFLIVASTEIQVRVASMVKTGETMCYNSTSSCAAVESGVPRNRTHGEIRLAFVFLTNGTGQSTSSFHAAAAHTVKVWLESGNRRQQQ